VRLRREIRERKARMWKSRRLVAYLQTFSSAIFVCAALLSGIARCLKSTQVTTEASSIKWAEQVHIPECGAYSRTLNWNSTWSLSDDVSRVQSSILRNGLGSRMINKQTTHSEGPPPHLHNEAKSANWNEKIKRWR